MTAAQGYAFWSIARRAATTPVQFRELLQQMGPTFIKVGQFLALRPDIIPQEYCDELMLLFDQVPPFPWQSARAILIEDLGAAPTELFAYMNPRPVAAGSLAQVHVARLKDGTEVAVKIQRPNIRERVLRDINRTQLIARLLELSRASSVVSPRDVVQELTTWMMQELDFDHELANQMRLYRLTADSTFEVVPAPYPEFCGTRVLTAEYLRGVRVSDLLLAGRPNHPDEAAYVAATEIDRDQVAINLISACLRQIFRYRFFHADLHPGNLMVLPGNVIGFVDFGLCDELDETVREGQLRYLTAVYSGSEEQMFQALTEILIPSEQTDMEAFRRDFLAETREWQGRRKDSKATSDANIHDADATNPSPVGEYMIALMRTARRHSVQVPSRVLSMYRALLTAETVAHELGSNVDLGYVGRRFFSTLRTEEALRALQPDNLQPTVLSLLNLFRDSPGQVNQILSELTDGTFGLNVYVTESARVTRAQNRRVRLITTAIVSVGVATLLITPWLTAQFGDAGPWVVVSVLLVLYLSIYIQWRRLR